MKTKGIIKKNKPFLISICSGKGGVGKSFIAANLSSSLSKSNKTLLWDVDVYFPNQHLMFGLEPPIRLNDVYSNDVPVNRAIYNVAENFYLLADTPATGKFDLLRTIDIKKIYDDIVQEFDFDIIIMDTAAGGTFEVLQCAMLSDMIIVVITDEPTSLLDAYALVKLFLPYLETENIKLIVNNVIDSDDAVDVSQKLNLATDKFLELQLEYIGYIPYSRLVRLSIIQQKILIESYPDDDITNAIENIADDIINKIENKRINQTVNMK